MSVAIVVVLILVNGLFAMSEIAVVSANRFRLAQLAEAGNAAAARALALAQNPNRFLSTVQVGITLVGVVSGAFGGAALAGPLAERLQRVDWLAPYAQPVAFGLVVAGITYLSLVIGELVPKRVGLSDPDRVAMSVANLMHRISQFARPVVWLLAVSTEGLVRLLRIKQVDDTISESDIETLIAQGRQAGVVEPEEQEIIENAFWLGERRVNDIMTPRHQVVWLPVDAGPEEVKELVGRSPHGRYLVADGDLDNVVGFVSSADLLVGALSGDLDLAAHMQEPVYVPETLPILAMLDRFRETGKRLAVVVDEYGGFEGVLTLGDILEELVGDVVPDAEDPEVVETDDGWLVDGGLHVDEFAELLGLDRETRLQDAGFQTVGGLVAAELGRIPDEGDAFEWHGHRIVVTAMDGQRLAQVRVSRSVGAESEER
ncbi:MAG TPA: hemolysin family protein [Trueperaceae bacterium]